MASIKMDEWFRKDYDPAYLDDDEEDINTQNEAIPTHQEVRPVDLGLSLVREFIRGTHHN